MESIDYYLKSVARRWKKEIIQASDKVIILSPYLTSKTAEIVLENLDIIENCEIYTVFSMENFVSGASSLRTVKILSQRGLKLYHLPRLHAKIILVPQKFVSIGSQNLTRNGVKNKEASVVICNPQEVAKIEKRLDSWIAQRQLISSGMLDEAEKSFLALRRKFCAIQREANNLESEIWENEAKRLEEARLAKEAEELRERQEEEQRLELARLQREIQEKRQVEERKRIEQEILKKEAKPKIKLQEEWRKKINAGRARVGRLVEHGEIERSLAEEFIRESAYWHDHPCGHPVNAPSHAKRIYGSKNNWRIDFGANTFLVGHAIWRCQKTLLEFLDSAEAGNITPLEELREKLKLGVRGAVANYEGYEYEVYYPETYNGYIKFGTQAIHTKAFVNLILRKVKLGDLLTIKAVTT